MNMEQQSKTGDRYLTLVEVAGKINACANTVRRLVRDGKFPKPKRWDTRAVRWLESEVQAWMQNPAGWQASAAA